MSALQALLVFVGIPVALAVVIFGMVSASGWTRSGRASADYAAGPFLVASDPAVPNPSIVPSDYPDAVVTGGGLSAQW